MIKYIIKYPFDDTIELFNQFPLEFQLPENPPFYSLITNNDEKCLLGYVEGYGENNFCRVISNIYNLTDVLREIDNYKDVEEIREINKEDFKNITINIRSLNEAIELLKITNESENTFLYRGQANKDWSIESSLFRNGYKGGLEYSLYSEIRQLNHHQFDSMDFVKLSSDMQHYGIPTRLVDWTGNLLNAIYFSCVSGLAERTRDGAVFMVNAPDIIEVDSDVYLDIAKFLKYRFTNQLTIEEGLFDIFTRIFEDKKNYKFFKTRYTNERIKRQDGYFSICFERNEEEALSFLKFMIKGYFKRNYEAISDDAIENITKEIQMPFSEATANTLCEQARNFNLYSETGVKIEIENLKEALNRFSSINSIDHIMNSIQINEQHLKIVIPSQYKDRIIKELNQIGINSSTMYPDLEGMTKHLREKYSK